MNPHDVNRLDFEDHGPKEHQLYFTYSKDEVATDPEPEYISELMFPPQLMKDHYGNQSRP